MEENWKNGIYGATRVFNNKYELKHHNGKIISFDSKEELDEYLQEYHTKTCELSQSFINDMEDDELEEDLGYRFYDDECRGNQ